MSHRPKGKHVRVDQNSPFGLGICDYTGFVFNKRDLVKQMEWRGNALVWTGLIVGRPYADVPNEQNRPPILPLDPVPFINPRTQQQTLNYWNTLSLLSWNAMTTPLNAIETDNDGIEALPVSQRLAPLKNYNWGW